MEFFYSIVDEHVSQNSEELIKWVALEEDEMDFWMEDQLNNACEYLDASLTEYLIDKITTTKNRKSLYKYIQTMCRSKLALQ
jgi:hypothetical protein